MKILIVIDQFDNSNNGTTISARRFAKDLQDRGNEVYIVSTGDKKEAILQLKEDVYSSMCEAKNEWDTGGRFNSVPAFFWLQASGLAW